MGVAENKALVKRWFEEVWRDGREETIDALFHPEGVAHFNQMPEELRGPEGVKQVRRLMAGAFSDFRVSIESMLADGNEVGVRWVASGTHDGELMGLPPTHEDVTFNGATWVKIEGDRIVEFWINGNLSGVMRSLLDDAITELRALRGLLPICAWCKKIKNEDGQWERLEAYVQSRSTARFTHGVCEDCSARVDAADGG